MIEVKINKLSEFIWISSVIQMGCLNPDKKLMHDLKDHGIDIDKKVTYTFGKDFENDLGGKYDEIYRELCSM